MTIIVKFANQVGEKKTLTISGNNIGRYSIDKIISKFKEENPGFKTMEV